MFNFHLLQKEIDGMRDMFMGQLNEVTEKYMKTQQVLEEVQKQRSEYKYFKNVLLLPNLNLVTK